MLKSIWTTTARAFPLSPKMFPEKKKETLLRRKKAVEIELKQVTVFILSILFLCIGSSS